MIDSHAHVGRPEFDPDREDVVARAVRAGISVIVEAGTDALTSRRAIDLARTHRCVRAAVGIHPCDVRSDRAAELEVIESLAREPEVVAIGETGLDFHWEDSAPPEVQEEFLRRHIAISRSAGKPLVLHHRNAGNRVAEILEEEGPQISDVGVVVDGGSTGVQGDLPILHRDHRVDSPRQGVEQG